jgi:predicted RNA-binding Zn-ribbon protein involved in translation (DUF1610 family)
MLPAALKRSKYCQPCNKILGDKKWERNCPDCDSIIKYLSYNGYLVAIKNKSKCKTCNQLSKKALIPEGGWAKNCPECGKLQTYTTNASLRFAIRQNARCKDCSKKIAGVYLARRYSLRACEFMDNYGKKYGYEFQHARNSTEYQVDRYFLDGYDKEKNVVFEYDEQQHFKGGNLIPDDIVRQSKIIDLIRPIAFFRYNEPKKILTEVISGKEIKL